MLVISPTSFAWPPLFDWVCSPDGVRMEAHGSGAGAEDLPHVADCTLVLSARWVSWQQVRLPRVSAARLRVALVGLLEDRLIEDAEAVHFALQMTESVDKPTWVACCNRQWLQRCLDALHAVGLMPTHIAPCLWPDDLGPAVARVHACRDNRVWLSLATVSGVGHWPLDAAVPVIHSLGLSHHPVHCSAPESLVAQAEATLGMRCLTESDDSWLLRAARSPWNLAQFEFSRSPRRLRLQRWREIWRTLLHEPAWRPLRWSAIALLAVQIAGLNLYAWQLSQHLQDTRARQRQVVQTQFPSVTLVIDPLKQMRRELDSLGQRSGAVGAADLESLLAALGGSAVSASWRGLNAIEHDASSTRLTAEALGDGLLSDWQSRLSATGLQMQTEDQSLVVRR